jgi:hypothetical protein
MAIVAKWRGLGPEDPGLETHYGIPARDLTDDDWARLDDEQRATVEGSKLYAVRAKAAEKAEAPAEPAKADDKASDKK